MATTVIVTDEVHPLLLSGLAAKGYACIYEPEMNPRDLLGRMSGVCGLVINSKIRIDAAFLAASPELRFVARLGSGLEIIDLEATQSAKVAVYRSPEGNCDAVAEQGIGMLLSLLHQLRLADVEVRQKIWRRAERRGRELGSRCIGLLGFGYTGKAIAKRLLAFGCRVLAYDKYLPKGYAQAVPGVEEADLEAIYQEADTLSLHLPLSEETRAWVNLAFLSRFAKPLILLNTSRGEIVPTADLLQALNQGILEAAALDVFENEKPQTYSPEQEILFAELFAKDNVLLSPHIAGWTQESKIRLAQVLLDKIPELGR